MPLFNKSTLSSFFGLAGEEEDYEQYEEKPVVAPVRQPKQTVAPQQPARPRVTQQQTTTNEPLMGKPSARYRSTETVETASHTTERTMPQPKKVVSMHNSSAGIGNKMRQKAAQANKITILEPRVYSEAMNIAKHLIASDTILVNFHLVEESQARRIVDFLTGTVYALDGDIQRVGDEIFLCTPSNVEIDSATAQSLANKQMFDF